jgi:uncharacterized RDD family membrane protein YckC
MSRPAGFWRRFAAVVIDTLLFLPFTIPLARLTAHDRTLTVAYQVLSLPLIQSYSILCHARGGQTVGKWLLRARVVSLDGGPLTLLQSVLRSSVDAGFSLLGVCLNLALAFSVSESEFAAGFKHSQIYEAKPGLGVATAFLGLLAILWFGGSLLSLLTSERKRMLHDLLAETEVIVVKD